jgi:hypothetical protein
MMLLLALLFLCRRWVAQVLVIRLAKLPGRIRYLVAPSLATLFFTVTWAGVHFGMESHAGLLPEKLFPAVIGLFSWAVTRYNFVLRNRLCVFPMMKSRDAIPRFIRIAIILLLALLLSLVSTLQTRVTAFELKEQLIVIVTLIGGYLLLSDQVPREQPMQSISRSDIE